VCGAAREVVTLRGDEVPKAVGHPFVADLLQRLHDMRVMTDDQIDVG
jgi:hypothetical protein